MFEYMSAGIPVICSNFPLWRDIIEKHQCGICVDPQNSSEIALAIDFLAQNPKEAKVMGKMANMLSKGFIIGAVKNLN